MLSGAPSWGEGGLAGVPCLQEQTWLRVPTPAVRCLGTAMPKQHLQGWAKQKHCWAAGRSAEILVPGENSQRGPWSAWVLKLQTDVIVTFYCSLQDSDASGHQCPVQSNVAAVQLADTFPKHFQTRSLFVCLFFKEGKKQLDLTKTS